MKEAIVDVKSGNYVTPNVMVSLLPFLFILTILIIACHTPAKIYDDEPPKKKVAKKND